MHIIPTLFDSISSLCSCDYDCCLGYIGDAIVGPECVVYRLPSSPNVGYVVQRLLSDKSWLHLHTDPTSIIVNLAKETVSRIFIYLYWDNYCICNTPDASTNNEDNCLVGYQTANFFFRSEQQS